MKIIQEPTTLSGHMFTGFSIETKLVILFAWLSLIASFLTGCANSATPTLSTDNELSTATRLALGTLKLEGTNNAVTTTEADQLLTLWQGYESISSSDITSQVELDALVKQIEGSMTDAQVKAINAMDLAAQSVSETLSTLSSTNASTLPSSTPNDSTLSQSGTSTGASGMPSSVSGVMPSASSGSMPSGAPGGMAPGGDSSGVNSVLNGVTAQSTQTTTQTSCQTGATQVSPILLKVLIQMLETRSLSAG